MNTKAIQDLRRLHKGDLVHYYETNAGEGKEVIYQARESKPR
jgi:hypothetical protein